MGPLIFNLYINDLNKNLTESCRVVQYAYDTLLFCDVNDTKNTLQLVQKSCQNLSLYFTNHSLKLNTKKTELILLSNKHQGSNHNSKLSVLSDANKIEEKPEVKYLRVILDQFLTFQGEINKILRKMACGIKTLQSKKTDYYY